MGSVNVESFFAPISPEQPSGPSLRDEVEYAAFFEMAKGTPAKEMGDSVIPAVEPNWKDVKTGAVSLLYKTRDLRLVQMLGLALVKLEGISGLADALAITRGLLEKHWPTLHPEIDPDPEYGAGERVQIVNGFATPLGTMGDPLQFLSRLREVPISNAPKAGRFSLRDIQLSKPETPVPEGVARPDPGLIAASFGETSDEDLKATLEACTAITEHLKAITAEFVKYPDQIASSGQPNFSALEGLLAEIRKPIQAALAERGGGGDAVAAGAEGGKPERKDAGISGDVRSPQEAVVALNKVLQYYDRWEPSSPVPLFLKGAQKMVGKKFEDISKVLTPSAVAELVRISTQEDKK